jgi:hypothetical protein
MWSVNIPEEDYIRIPKEEWDIRDTIPKLSYLTHNFLRYYGKYIPPIATNLIKRYTKSQEIILDNFTGCGTGLVEAKLHGRHAIGVEINPLGVLASKVKTTLIKPQRLAIVYKELLQKVSQDVAKLEKKNNDVRLSIPSKEDFPSIAKWFTQKQIDHLGALRHHVFELDGDSALRDFFRLAFGAIIRRCSLAFDGEVRPHINKKKRPRKVLAAFRDKVSDMIRRMKEFELLVSSSEIEVHEIDSRNFRSEITKKASIFHEKTVDLIISHPPYLNAFDYAPVFRPTMLWLGLDYEGTKKKEIRAWPATNEKIVENYFKNLKLCFDEMYEVIRPRGTFCLIIGDCTIRKKPLPTHKVFINMLTEIGFKIEKIISRKPYYTTGRYSYEQRALKKERILVFRAP